MKFLVDTSVWIDHLYKTVTELERILKSPDNLVLHPFVRGELSLSNSPKVKILLKELEWFPDVKIATHTEVIEVVDNFKLKGIGIGWIDCHLFASCKLANVKLLTHDKVLKKIADQFL